MSAARAGGGVGPGTPTLGAFTGGQLRRLCAVAGLSEADADTYAQVLSDALGPVAGRPLDLPPPSRTFLSDDHTPVEYSLSFRPGSAPAVRVLVEPGCGAGSLARSGRTGLETVRAMTQRWDFATDALDALEDLFLPPEPQGTLALWCALELRPGGVPGVKVYLDPAANGAERSAQTVREALRRLGHHQAFDVLPEADGYPFLALDLGDWDAPRVKVYLRHDALSATGAGHLCRMRPGPDPASVAAFHRAAAGPKAPLLTGRPGLTCHSFTDTGSAWPSGFTLHIPVRDYAEHDGEALARATEVLRRYGIDAGVLPDALAALTSRRPEDGVGLIAYLALAHQQNHPPRITTYLSAEAYAVRPPNRAPARSAQPVH
ncbi:prenyltransferase [Streptomyces sp. 15-116A]|uniref:tryptophan dimethylallyltransferase family protein n=1 Tax=Streptomyces sp. 15-116A TaxID=2259035 RepID=UPI0021B492EC|nr:tryptophan dimethylallyltransferase family protein [Streptomyces sp. 15-116A]MCT7355175.1 prenyltransferase [Streptomyces sp. 15-116A]